MKKSTSKHDIPLFLFIILVLVNTNILAAPVKYALLVGISEYHIKPLAGPVNDVRAIRKSLIRHWGFQSTNIKVLLNRQATKKNILDKIKKLYDISKSGDEVFIYFSGHGTSASDKSISAPLPTTTGAFIPIDVKNLDNIDDLVNKLIVGKNDMRPLLSRFDEGMRNVFVAIDACYSGNTVRGIRTERQLPSRFLRIKDLVANNNSVPILTARGLAADVIETDSHIGKIMSYDDDNIYPYKNIFYLSASGEHEPAQDIPLDMLDLFPTIDAKPHGAFTDSLLRVLNKELDSDLNRNGQISYAELKKTLRNIMRKRGFNHTPQGLPTLAEDQYNLSGRAIFGFTRDLNKGLNKVNVKNLSLRNENKLINSALDKLKIRLDPTLNFLASTLNKQPQLRIVNSQEDIVVKRLDGNIVLLSPTGDVINSTKDIDRADLLNFLNSQQWLKNNLNDLSTEDFFVELEYHKSGLGSTLVEGEFIGFTIRSSQDAYLLLINIDSEGLLRVIFPFRPSEVKMYPGKHLTILKNISKVGSPFGRDVMQLYAFDKMTDDLQKLRGKEFKLGSPLMRTFERLINNPKLKKAKANLMLYTVPRI